ncbi:DUF4371 domain-containing protein [Trichonephila inaurata madagascariensis]|uniref:DUF4371 domain-containing protein n=1 Tax=Trichonephila inaurata madagascariensis TaxID=2747483 RepID=A0A8X6XL50_9ARAC|nr:DUF4371 domain-containing protein [Trichonephila inaurata madagascariensis]
MTGLKEDQGDRRMTVTAKRKAHAGSKEASSQIRNRLKKKKIPVSGTATSELDISQYNLWSRIKEAAESRPSRGLMQDQGGPVRPRERRRQESRSYNKEHKYKQQSKRQSRQEQEQEPRSGRSSHQSSRTSRGAKQQQRQEMGEKSTSRRTASLEVLVRCPNGVHLHKLWVTDHERSVGRVDSGESVSPTEEIPQALIRKVISPELPKGQIAEINKSQFSLILDESTGVACCKHLCLCVRYCNGKENKIVSQFLGLVEVLESTTDSLYKHVKDFFNKIGINLGNCFAIGTDGASNLCGKKSFIFYSNDERHPKSNFN